VFTSSSGLNGMDSTKVATAFSFSLNISGKNGVYGKSGKIDWINIASYLGACPRIEAVARNSWFESVFSLI